MLKSARDSAVKARTQAVNQMKAPIVTAPADLRETLDGLPNAALVTRCAGFRPFLAKCGLGWPMQLVCWISSANWPICWVGERARRRQLGEVTVTPKTKIQGASCAVRARIGGPTDMSPFRSHRTPPRWSAMQLGLDRGIATRNRPEPPPPDLPPKGGLYRQGVACPNSSLPQQTAVPSGRRPQVCFAPLLIDRKISSAGGDACPLS